MKKKTYTAPAFSAEEIEMADIVCQSFKANKVGGGTFNEAIMPGNPNADPASAPRAKGRGGIWDDEE